jgi:hypothetical protein
MENISYMVQLIFSFPLESRYRTTSDGFHTSKRSLTIAPHSLGVGKRFSLSLLWRCLMTPENVAIHAENMNCSLADFKSFSL